jgi:hypothetical protein
MAAIIVILIAAGLALAGSQGGQATRIRIIQIRDTHPNNPPAANTESRKTIKKKLIVSTISFLVDIRRILFH